MSIYTYKHAHGQQKRMQTDANKSNNAYISHILTQTHLRVRLNIHTHVYIYMNINAQGGIDGLVHIHLHLQIPTHTHTHIDGLVHIHLHLQIPTHTHTHRGIQTFIDEQRDMFINTYKHAHVLLKKTNTYIDKYISYVFITPTPTCGIWTRLIDIPNLKIPISPNIYP